MSDPLTDRHQLHQGANELYDLLIVGGGINGAGIARDAAGRGLKVLLVEQDDLANHTSSASTKLIHGGLRYLEQGDFRLVRESLIERERLWAMAPHIIRPLRFVLPQTRSPRPAWLVRLGLFIYDHLGGREKLPPTETIALEPSTYAKGLADRSGKAFLYSDCWVDDSRLVILNAIDASERGAEIRTRTRFLAARREAGVWVARLSNGKGPREIRARVLVNAAGPWVSDVIDRAAGVTSQRGVRLVKGSHIVLPRLYEGDHAFMLQNDDRRIVFAIPYEGRFTLVGTTDQAWAGAPEVPHISADETAYLLQTANRYFSLKVGPEDVQWSYAGIRPLYDDKAGKASTVTRDYVLDIDGGDGKAPVLSVFGGKITTYRKLAEHAMRALGAYLPGAGQAWTAGVALPGGDMPHGNFEAFLFQIEAARPGLSPAILRRLARAYGTRIDRILGTAANDQDLGENFGSGLTRAEVDYLTGHEWARSVEDVIYRRSKIGLHLSTGGRERLSAYLEHSLGTATE